MTSAVAVRLLEREAPTSTSGGSMSRSIITRYYFINLEDIFQIKEEVVSYLVLAVLQTFIYTLLHLLFISIKVVVKEYRAHQ